MLEQILASLIGTVTTLVAVVFMSRKMDQKIDATIDHFADLISGVFEKPIVKQGMSLLGKKSGQVRAEKATVDKFNMNVPKLIPSLGLIGERLGMEPTELLQLWSDPMIGPMIQGVLGSFLGAQQNGGLPGLPEKTVSNTGIPVMT